MTDPIADNARRAAERLSVEFRGVIEGVEAALGASEPARRPDRYLDPISLGTLIVSVAQLAWTVYTNLKKHTPPSADPPSVDDVARSVRIQLRDTEVTPPDQRDRIIDVVVQETVDSADPALREPSRREQRHEASRKQR